MNQQTTSQQQLWCGILVDLRKRYYHGSARESKVRHESKPQIFRNPNGFIIFYKYAFTGIFKINKHLIPILSTIIIQVIKGLVYLFCNTWCTSSVSNISHTLTHLVSCAYCSKHLPESSHALLQTHVRNIFSCCSKKLSRCSLNIFLFY